MREFASSVDWLRSGVLVVVVAIVATACTSVTPPGGAPTSSPIQASSPTQAPRTLTIAMDAEPTTLNSLYESANTTTWTVMGNMYETLARLDLATNEVKPWLATGWKQVDPTTWQITARSGVKFHDGSTMTADDIVASINHTLAKGSTQRDRVATLKAAQKIDASTVQITTSVPDPVFPLLLQSLAVAAASAVAKGGDFLATNVVGTGPYKLVGWAKGQSLTLTRFNDYWGDAPQAQDVTIVWRGESSVRADMVRTGEAQIAQALSVSNLQGLKVASVPSLQTYVLFLNNIGQTAGSVMTDKRVRMAVSLAIDRKAMVDQIYGAQAALTHGNLVGSPAILGYSSKMQDFVHDPKKATNLVNEAGAAGKPVSFVCTGGSRINDRELCQFIAAQLNQVGLKVTMTYPADAVWLETYRAGPAGRNRPDILLGTLTTDTLDVPSRNAHTFFKSRRSGGSGGGTMDDPRLDQMAADARAEADLSKRRALAEQMTKYIVDEAYMIALLAPNYVWGVAKNVDFQPSPTGALELSSVRYKN